jgi:alpha-L-fucosidase
MILLPVCFTSQKPRQQIPHTPLLFFEVGIRIKYSVHNWIRLLQACTRKALQSADNQCNLRHMKVLLLAVMWSALLTSLNTLAAAGSNVVPPPQPYGPVPAERQLRWHEMEFYGFLHFTVNTFTDKEWGYGDEDEKVFNPTDFDADQIVLVAKRAGMKGLILTAKHHDGFCLWPSRYTEHSVKNSPWKGGHGDVVKEISTACRRHGLKFGVYLSPWDRNHKDYGRPEYVTYYRNELRELLTNYGDIFTVWFDGANGGDGFYGGAREKRQIDNRIYYDWDHTWQIVRELMPGAVMFSDAGPDFRWVGNESGIAGDPCWATLNAAGRYPGGSSAHLNSGERPGTHWLPAECDVSIRPGWFYHASEDAQVKTPRALLDIYYKAVGRGACLNLNLPPDRRGRIHEDDIRSLTEFRRILDATFSKDLARGAKLTASNTRGGAKQFAAVNLLDHKRDTYWCTDDNVATPELVLAFGKPITFNVVSLREYLPLGQRVEGFALDQFKDGQWVEFAKGTSIGNLRLVRGEYVTTEKVRLRITQSPVSPALAELGLYAEPAQALALHP